jgi:branched-chain amino acid transport system permease protein
MSAAISLTSVSKAYGGLRPLRLRELIVNEGDVIGLAGFDQVTAEVFVNLVTGATLPDAGDVEVFGRRTADIADTDEWLSLVDRFGIISERVVLLPQYTAAQNIAMSLTLDVEPVSAEVRRQVETLGGEAGLDGGDFDTAAADGPTALRHRIRLARALAQEPRLLLVEHPAASVAAADLAALSADLARVASARGLAVVVLAANHELASPFAPRVMTLDPATGALAERRGGLLGRLFGRHG